MGHQILCLLTKMLSRIQPPQVYSTYFPFIKRATPKFGGDERRIHKPLLIAYLPEEIMQALDNICRHLLALNDAVNASVTDTHNPANSPHIDIRFL
jgi:hypothetical protein